MAQDKKAVCGNTTIRFPPECAFVCVCTPNDGCSWMVSCGGWTTGGSGLTVEQPHHPHPQVTVDGKLAVLATIFQKLLKKRITIPAKLKSKRVRRRTIRGTPAKAAQALGLEL